MKYSVYKHLSTQLTSLHAVNEFFNKKNNDNNISLNTLLSIFSQYNQLINQKQSKLLKNCLSTIINNYNSGESVVSIAKRLQCSACQLIRLIICELYRELSKRAVTVRLINPQIFTELHSN